MSRKKILNVHLCNLEWWSFTFGRNDKHSIKYFPQLHLENKEYLDLIIEKCLYNDVFKDELGIFNKYEIVLNVKTGAVSKFYKLKFILLALKTKVDTEIECLVKSDLLIPVDLNDWATPIVSILKPGGSIRICGDFKIILNPVFEATECPLPKIEHMFTNINGSKYLSKIDFKNAYHK